MSWGNRKGSRIGKAPRVHYLPHQAVVRKESATSKVRVVYDASAKESKSVACLNDCFHVGPPLTPLLYNILLRSRENRVVLVGDIEKAFLNVEVDPEDRDCLPFLWVEKPPDLSQVNASRFDRRLFRSKVVSIDKSRFDRRQESFRSKTRVFSIEDCNYCSKCIQLTIYQICLKIFPDTVKRRSLSFFQRYIVRDISLARYFWECWLIEILSAILNSTRHGGQSRERHFSQPLRCTSL